MIEKRPCVNTERVLVTFRISRAIWADRIAVVGDFYGQQQEMFPMVPSVVDPDWHVTLSLVSGRSYRFLYLFDDKRYIDDHADTYSVGGDRRVYGIVDTAPGLGLPGVSGTSWETSTPSGWLKDLVANTVNATRQVASRDTIDQRLMSRTPAIR